jgi:hypothetical protein
LIAQMSPPSLRTRKPSSRAAAPDAVVDTTAQCAMTLLGGCSPDGASEATPKSTTTATRFLPGSEATPEQTAAKDGAVRGGVLLLDAPVDTAKRQPSTAPSAGRVDPAPTGE